MIIALINIKREKTAKIIVVQIVKIKYVIKMVYVKSVNQEKQVYFVKNPAQIICQIVKGKENLMII